MLKKSINSAYVNYDSRKRRFNLERHSEKGLITNAAALRFLRLWIFISTSAFLVVHISRAVRRYAISGVMKLRCKAYLHERPAGEAYAALYPKWIR